MGLPIRIIPDSYNQPNFVTLGTENASDNDSDVSYLTLVNSYKSRQKNTFVDKFEGFEVFKDSVRMVRKTEISSTKCSGGLRKAINSFSHKSRRNLEFKVRNSAHALISQFCLTYHETWPSDGSELKTHLDNFLRSVRREYPGVHYLWVLEFQTRTAPHFHFFSTIEATIEVGNRLAEIWNRVIAGSQQHLRFHKHPSNFLPWELTKPGYVTKYLEKEYQKVVPDNFENVGRFWGASRNIVAQAIFYSRQMFGVMYQKFRNEHTGELEDPQQNWKQVYRILRKWHESKVRYMSKKYGKPRKYRSGLTRFSSYLLMSGAAVLRQVMEYQHNRFYVPF